MSEGPVFDIAPPGLDAGPYMDYTVRALAAGPQGIALATRQGAYMVYRDGRVTSLVRELGKAPYRGSFGNLDALTFTDDALYGRAHAGAYACMVKYTVDATAAPAQVETVSEFQTYWFGPPADFRGIAVNPSGPRVYLVYGDSRSAGAPVVVALDGNLAELRRRSLDPSLIFTGEIVAADDVSGAPLVAMWQPPTFLHPLVLDGLSLDTVQHDFPNFDLAISGLTSGQPWLRIAVDGLLTSYDYVSRVPPSLATPGTRVVVTHSDVVDRRTVISVYGFPGVAPILAGPQVDPLSIPVDPRPVTMSRVEIAYANRSAMQRVAAAPLISDEAGTTFVYLIVAVDSAERLRIQKWRVPAPVSSDWATYWATEYQNMERSFTGRRYLETNGDADWKCFRKACFAPLSQFTDPSRGWDEMFSRYQRMPPEPLGP